MSTGSPCAACKFLRRKCAADCAFAPYFPPEDPHKFANVHKLFGASNVSKLLCELPPCAREDAVCSLAYEAEARLKDPVYGCAGAIAILQCRVAQLQAELVAVRSELCGLKRDGGGDDAQILQCKPPSDTLLPLQKSSPHAISSSTTTSNFTVSHAPASAISSFSASPYPRQYTRAFNPASSSAFLLPIQIPPSITSLAYHADQASASSPPSLRSSTHPFFNILSSSPSSTVASFSDITRRCSSTAVGDDDRPSTCTADRYQAERRSSALKTCSMLQANPTHLGRLLAEANHHDMQDASSSSDTNLTTAKCDYGRASASSRFNAAEVNIKLEDHNCQ